MNLKRQLKWRLNDLLALDALPKGSAEAAEKRKALLSECTAASAADIMHAAPGSKLSPRRRQRKVWATLGYVVIVLFLLSAAALVLGYWMVSDHKVDWLSRGTLFMLLAAMVVEVALMLLCANRVTALQNRYTLGRIRSVMKEYDALGAEDRALFPRLLAQGFSADRRAGCCACGALFGPGEVAQPESGDLTCPGCGEPFQLVFEGDDAPLDADTLNRLRSFLDA